MGKRYLLKICFVIWVGALMGANSVFAQSIDKIKVGDAMPDLPLPTLTKYFGKKVSIASFRGKYLILDFWATTCAVCVAAFPEMETLQRLFDDKLQIILVNPSETQEQIDKRMYNANSWGFNISKLRLPNLPSITGEKRWRTMFPYFAIPHHIWIDPSGKVMAITGGYNANENTLRSILRGNKIDMVFKPESNFNLQHKPLHAYLKDQLAQPTEWSYISNFYEGEGANAGGLRGIGARGIIDTVAGTIRYSFMNNTFEELFKEVAYIQKSFLYGRKLTIKETTDDPLIWQVSTPDWYFRPTEESKWDDWVRRAGFCYEIEMPLSKRNEIPAIMLNDLNNYFEKKLGLRAQFEKMPRKCWVIRVTGKDKLPRSQKGEQKIIYPSKDNDQTFTFLHTPFSEIVGRIDNVLKSSETGSGLQILKPALLIDSTGITGAVDMKLTNKVWGQPDPASIFNKFLEIYGLSIEQKVVELEMLVIRDR